MRSVRSTWQYWFSMMFSDFSYGLQKIVQLHHEACLTPGILARYEYGAMKEKKTWEKVSAPSSYGDRLVHNFINPGLTLIV